LIHLPRHTERPSPWCELWKTVRYYWLLTQVDPGHGAGTKIELTTRPLGEPMHETLMETLTRLMAHSAYDADAQLSEHQRDSFGMCTCSTHSVKRPWPCASKLAADQARYLQQLRAQAAGQRVG
jgi:hypothetical protein